MEEDALVINLAERRLTIDSEEPSRFVHFIKGSAARLTDDYETQAEIGLFTAIYIDVIGAVVDGVSVFYVFDSHQTTLGYYEDLYDYETNDFRRPIVKAAAATATSGRQAPYCLEASGCACDWKRGPFDGPLPSPNQRR